MIFVSSSSFGSQQPLGEKFLYGYSNPTRSRTQVRYQVEKFDGKKNSVWQCVVQDVLV